MIKRLGLLVAIFGSIAGIAWWAYMALVLWDAREIASPMGLGVLGTVVLAMLAGAICTTIVFSLEYWRERWRA